SYRGESHLVIFNTYLGDRTIEGRAPKNPTLREKPTPVASAFRYLRLVLRLLFSPGMKRLLKCLGTVPMMMLMLTGNCGRGSSGGDNPERGSASEALDTTTVVQSEGAVFVAGTDSVDVQMSGTQAATAAAASARTYWQPSACVTSTASG